MYANAVFFLHLPKNLLCICVSILRVTTFIKEFYDDDNDDDDDDGGGGGGGDEQRIKDIYRGTRCTERIYH